METPDEIIYIPGINLLFTIKFDLKNYFPLLKYITKMYRAIHMYGTNIYFYLNPTNIPVTLYISVQKYIILYIHNRDIQ